MKKGILLLPLVSSVCVQAQSLKDALYGGKLKNQPGTVVRKGDDLTKIDTVSQVVPEETAKTDVTSSALDSSANTTITQTDSAAVVSTTENEGDSTVTTDTTTVVGQTAIATETAPAPRNNNTVWKSYVDSVASVLKTEALPSKKVKRGSYYVLVSYTIDTEGEVTVNDVFISPENAYLQQQVKDRMALETPRLEPVLNSTGKPRKVNKKSNFTLIKE